MKGKCVYIIDTCLHLINLILNMSITYKTIERYTFIKMCCLIQISIIGYGVFGNFSSTNYHNHRELKLACGTNSNYYHSSTFNNEDYKFLYNYLQGNGMHKFDEYITIGFLGAYGQAQVVLGALPLAVEDINNSTGDFVFFFI